MSQYKNNTVEDSLIKGLNEQQKMAVIQDFTNHCLVLAGAGCGKTSVLTKRIAYCTQNFCTQKKILALTFTKKAALEMIERVMRLPGIDTGKSKPSITTFHAFGLLILRDTINGVPNFTKLGFSKEPKLLSYNQRISILAELSTIEQRKMLGGSIKNLDDFISKKTICPQKILSLSENKKSTLTDIYKQFQKIKMEKGLWEFSDMIVLTVKLLSNYSKIAKYYVNKYDYILVDEFQDTNPLQIDMLKLLLSRKNKLFAVGDDDQAVYGFRGADIEPILNFGEHFPGAVIHKLEINYRSTPAILSKSNKIFSDKPVHLRKILVSGKYQHAKKTFGQKPQKKIVSDTSALIDFIIKTALEIRENDGVKITEMALLFRENETLNNVKKLLGNRGVFGREMPMFCTIHGSKGLEFPVVFLCDLEESVFPSYPIKNIPKIGTWKDVCKQIFTSRVSINSICDIEEEKRLFYVGFTRAEKYLYLLSAKEKEFNGRVISFKPSRFFGII